MNISQLFQNLWIEKYRPQKLEDLVASDRLKQELLKFKEQGEIPHLLLCCGPGQGKTTIAKIITNDILNCLYLYINASDENGIDTIRTKVMNFAQTKSLDGNKKIVILDEADGLTAVAQQALRNVMEEWADNVRFILTANYLYKVITPIQSRCQSLDVSFPLDSCIRRVCEILVKERVVVESGQKEKLINLIRSNYPDLRKIIGLVQKNVINNKLQIDQQNVGLDFAQQIIEKLLTGMDCTVIRRFIIENEMQYNRDFHALMKDMFNSIEMKEGIEIGKKRLFLNTIAEHMYRHTFVMDPEINCYSCVIKLSDNI